MSVMLYPCMLCVALLMCLFVLCVACLTVFVNCLVKQFAMCVGVVRGGYRGGAATSGPPLKFPQSALFTRGFQ